MKMLWTLEPGGALILRGFKYEPLVHIGRADPDARTFIGPGFVGHLIEAGMPSCGPYKSRKAVTDWAEKIMAMRHPGVEFSDVPQFSDFPSDRKRKSLAKLA